MNIHTTIFSFILVLSTTQVNAFPQTGDPKAESVLKAYHTSLGTVRDFAADFIWETGNMRMGATKIGQVKYKKGMYMINFPDDNEQIFCDKAQQWIFNQERGFVFERDYDPYHGASLELIFENYRNKGVARYDGEDIIAGRNCHKVSINVQNLSSTYSQIVLWINSRTNLLEKAILLDYNQTTTTYTFSNIQLNQGFEDQEFRFDAGQYPNIEVIKE